MFNASARPLTDRLAIISTRAPGPLASRLQWITPSHFSGVNGDASLNLNGFDVRTIPGSDTLQILLVNHRPSLGPNVNSANSTIELFETQLGSSTMRHVRTFADEAIHAPNRVAWVAQDAFVFTNDRSPQGTFGRKLDLVLGGGSVGYCHSTGCHLIQPSGFRYPNGLVRGHDGLIYVPDSMTGKIHVFVLTRDKIFEEVDTIQLPYGIDNLSVDEDGDIFAATFPVSWKFLQSLKDPYGINPPMTIFRVRKREGGYEVEKVLEDDGSVLPAATTAVHDVKGEMMWMGGSFAPYVSVCQMH
ncbi:hypothetical protein MMC18_004795 [Xylographa bjoerkii]|nr:hypothetical protein [Xylographa bjoerkii]